ncbi:hypothetical protein C5167_025788 [Papaver somniferum]|uniref:Uncharacterized protein n=1 Tax=Papaver somniferum TaxID=3469 RepID=A0A4Y7JW92_PAPSO|nr:hypothetical protein C5167_025788 [Papaver somniferum]
MICSSRHNDIIPLLLPKGINVDVSNGSGSPLQYAAVASKYDIVKVLLDHGANPNLVLYDTFTPLHSSIYVQSWQCAEALLKECADPNGGSDGTRALPLAAVMGVVKIIRLHGLKPIEVSAYKDNRRGVEILFPVTSPFPSYVEWRCLKTISSLSFHWHTVNQITRSSGSALGL